MNCVGAIKNKKACSGATKDYDCVFCGKDFIQAKTCIYRAPPFSQLSSGIITYTKKKVTPVKGKETQYSRYKRNREKIFARDGYKCLICGSEDNLTADHIVPKSIGGSNALDNLQTLCRRCNGEKGSNIRDYRLIESKIVKE